MPGEAPQTYTVVQVREDDGKQKVTLGGVNAELDVWVPKGEQRPPLVADGQAQGWVNLQGKFGPYFRPAQNGSQTRSAAPSSHGRDDATGRSIERQTAAKVAGGIVASMVAGSGADLGDKPKFAEFFHFLVDTIHDAISGADRGPNPDDQIPFS